MTLSQHQHVQVSGALLLLVRVIGWPATLAGLVVMLGVTPIGVCSFS